MLLGKLKLLLSVVILAILFYVEISSAENTTRVYEVLSLNTGTAAANIYSQFESVTLKPYGGFAADSKRNILISDTINSRILRFSNEGVALVPLSYNDTPSFYPQNICLCDNDVVYSHNTRKQEVIAFSSSGVVLKSYNPASVFKNDKLKNVHILSIKCNKASIEVTFGMHEGTGKQIRPIYKDVYDQDFKLLNRKIVDDEAAYYKELREVNQVFEKHFTDASGNMYGYPTVKDWYGKFLPLVKYSPEKKLLSTIDGPFLSKHTKYKVYDYYTGRDMLVLDLKELRGVEFMIVNWYVTPSGIVYVLLANSDFVKVLRVEEK